MTELHLVSIVIPALNEEWNIPALEQALALVFWVTLSL